jgi:hypothetical protein
VVFIIGVDHIIQHNGFGWPAKSSAIKELSEYLEKIAREFDVTIIAEEFSEESLRINHVTMSTAQIVAKRINLKHLFCDPNREERKALGISSDDERERIWVECLRDVIKETILFICGDSHIESFKDKLLLEGVTAEIVSQGWGSELV